MPAERDDAPLPQPDAVPARSTVERAFQLARTGSYRTIEEISRQLKEERQEAVDAHLAGSSIRKDLRQICVDTRTLRSTPRVTSERPA
jgi:hypothetical protein